MVMDLLHKQATVDSEALDRACRCDDSVWTNASHDYQDWSYTEPGGIPLAPGALLAEALHQKRLKAAWKPFPPQKLWTKERKAEQDVRDPCSVQKALSLTLTLCLGFALVFLHGSPPWPLRPGRSQFEELAWRRVSLEGEFEDDVSRFLAANDSDTRMADVLVEFAAALVGNASTNSTWRLNFGFVLLKGNVSYELPLTDDYSMLQQQLLDPNFTDGTDVPLPRRTAEALRLCNEEIDRRGFFPPLSTALLVLTAGVSEDVPGTIERAAELKVAQKAVIYAIALDDANSRTPSRRLELERMATDESKEGSRERGSLVTLKKHCIQSLGGSVEVKSHMKD
eukprot:s100_g36.t1